MQRNESTYANILSFSELNPLKLKGKNKNAIALIIGVANYENAPEAKYADRDAEYFYDFSENVLGINKDNIKLISNKDANETKNKESFKDLAERVQHF